MKVNHQVIVLAMVLISLQLTKSQEFLEKTPEPLQNTPVDTDAPNKEVEFPEKEKTVETPAVQSDLPVEADKSEQTVGNDVPAVVEPVKEEKVDTKEETKEIAKEEVKEAVPVETVTTENKEAVITEKPTESAEVTVTPVEAPKEDAKEDTKEVVVAKPETVVSEPTVDKAEKAEKIDLNSEYDDSNDAGIYSFLTVVFLASIVYMAYLFYSQTQKYDFLNHDIQREMNYQLLPDDI